MELRVGKQALEWQLRLDAISRPARGMDKGPRSPLPAQIVGLPGAMLRHPLIADRAQVFRRRSAEEQEDDTRSQRDRAANPNNGSETHPIDPPLSDVRRARASR